jgi:hypothetical protein
MSFTSRRIGKGQAIELFTFSIACFYRRCECGYADLSAGSTASEQLLQQS